MTTAVESEVVQTVRRVRIKDLLYDVKPMVFRYGSVPTNEPKQSLNTRTHNRWGPHYSAATIPSCLSTELQATEPVFDTVLPN